MKGTLTNPYPRTFEEFLEWFPTEEDCAAYLEWIRWPDGFVCPQCGATKAWRTDRGLWHCQACRRQCSVPAGLSVYDKLSAAGFNHRPHVVTTDADAALRQLGHVHLVISLLKRWLGGTHQGAVTPAHLQAYLDEFSFRFNRRLSQHRGKLFHRLMQQAVTTRPPAVRALYASKPQFVGAT